MRNRECGAWIPSGSGTGCLGENGGCIFAEVPVLFLLARCPKRAVLPNLKLLSRHFAGEEGARREAVGR